MYCNPSASRAAANVVLPTPPLPEEQEAFVLDKLSQLSFAFHLTRSAYQWIQQIRIRMPASEAVSTI
jgi:hypothetical protein